MAVNWSIVLNILLLVGVLVAIIRTLRARRSQLQDTSAPAIGGDAMPHYDDIIAVRKVTPSISAADPLLHAALQPVVTKVDAMPSVTASVVADEASHASIVHTVTTTQASASSGLTLMLFLRAKAERHFVGYDLLQTVLAAGLRFGDGQLFHRHQQPNGHGPVMCSLAAATATGVFDLQQIGAFSARGLCLFMHMSGNTSIDAERFDIMLDTARNLCENLDAQLLDDLQQPFTEESLVRYQRKLCLEEAIC